ncbi:MAG: metal ABC transporter substrate-binding protein [Clostridia bacterium]|nr:metal ABC transporter substrate-binding protein [Clostridia bacterium]
MKKAFCAVLALLTLCAALAACSGGGESPATTAADPSGKISVVATVFPVYDWVRSVIGADNESFDLTMLLDSGVDLHSYQATAKDIMKISECDLFIYVGGQSDKWVSDALKNAVNENMIVLDLMELLGDMVREEELVEGMQGEEEEEEEDTEEDGPEYDEHIWLSLKNAVKCCEKIESAIEELDPANAAVFRANTDDYISRLEGLDAEYAAAVEAAPRKVLLFGDRFPFRYMTDDYGLDYYAAFVGCSAETEASFETIMFLAGKVDELGLDSVVCIEGSDCSLAETIINNSASKSAKIVTMDSMQTVTAAKLDSGADYLGIMQKNLDALKTALG